jgi:hypothetical protein
MKPENFNKLVEEVEKFIAHGHELRYRVYEKQGFQFPLSNEDIIEYFSRNYEKEYIKQAIEESQWQRQKEWKRLVAKVEMNKRIIELALKASLLNYIDHETPREYFVSGHADAENVIDFAHSIIQECVSVADHSVENGKSIIGERIKQHFGIEE